MNKVSVGEYRVGFGQIHGHQMHDTGQVPVILVLSIVNAAALIDRHFHSFFSSDSYS